MRPWQKKSLGSVALIPNPGDMDAFELREMAKSRQVVKSKINEWYDWLADHLPKSIREPVSSAFSGMKNRIMELYGDVKGRLKLKGQVEEQAKKEHSGEDQQGAEPVEHDHAINSAYKSFRIGSQKKTDVDSYITLVKPRVAELIGENVGVLNAVKVQMHTWITWKKREERLIALDDDMDGWTEEEKRQSQDSDGAYYTLWEKAFNSLTIKVYQGSNLEEILKGMFAHIKTQIEHPALPKSGFTLDHIMHLDIEFHELVLTRGGYIELPKWIATKKAVINPRNEDEKCFKWDVVAELHHEEIGNNPERVSKLKPFVERYNWEVSNGSEQDGQV